MVWSVLWEADELRKRRMEDMEPQSQIEARLEAVLEDWEAHRDEDATELLDDYDMECLRAALRRINELRVKYSCAHAAQIDAEAKLALTVEALAKIHAMSKSASDVKILAMGSIAATAIAAVKGE